MARGHNELVGDACDLFDKVHAGSLIESEVVEPQFASPFWTGLRDHGDEFFEHGGKGHQRTLYREVVHVPLIMRVLTGFASGGDLVYFPGGDELLGFIFLITIAFGLVFELPVVLWTLGMLRIISSRWLYRHRAYWLIGLGLLANFMTPGADPLTPLLVFVPLYVFWEATALLLKLTGR